MLRNKYFVIFISIVAIFVFYFFFIRGFLLKKQYKAPSVKSYVQAEEKRNEKESIDLNHPFRIKEIPASSSDEWGRELCVNTLPEEGEEVPILRELPKLTAIVLDKKRTFAVINGKIVKEGEQIDGILVKKILPNGVIIDRGLGEEFVYIFNIRKGGEIEKNN